MRAANEIEFFAGLVHAGAAALHALGLIYNLRRRNWTDAAIHGSVMVYDIAAARAHARALANRELETEAVNV